MPSTLRRRRARRLLSIAALIPALVVLTALTGWELATAVDVVVPPRPIIADPSVLAPRPRAVRAVDWTAVGGTDGAHYSPLDEITRANVESLRVAWVYRTGDASPGEPSAPGPATAFEATPIVLDGTLYLATPSARVVALDPERGTERWRFDAHLDRTAFAHDEVTARGVAAWVDSARAPGARCRTRIYLATFDARLIALDGATGRPCPDFGVGGSVDLGAGVARADRYAHDYHVTSPPAVASGVVIVGSSVNDGQVVQEPSGVVRAFDARTGALRWSWEPLVHERVRGAARFAVDDGFRSGAANAWGIFTVDPARDLVFVPTGSPSPDHYGALRPGDDRDANSIVALRASTGEEQWAFQLVHHDLWDYDVSAQSALMMLPHAGAPVPAVVQASKTGSVFILDRRSGRPLVPVVERPVPASDVPDEWASPTQPVPVAPPAVVPQGLRPEDAWGLTPADRAACAARIRALRSEGIFTPPSRRGSVVYPGFLGGVNWGGVAIDSGRGLAVMNTIRVAMIAGLVPRDSLRAESRRMGEVGTVAPQRGAPWGSRRELLRSPLGLPCSPPPWGTLVAVDLVRGRIAWQVPLGTMADFAHAPMPAAWGSPSLGGPLATAGGLVFIGAAMDHHLRAFDIATGRTLWTAELPASAQASPMTYRARAGGRQYVVIAAGGHHAMHTRIGDYLVAFALP